MTRNEAIQTLHAYWGTTMAIDLIDKLQEHGQISDNVVEPKETATCDLVAAAMALDPQPALK